MLRMCGLLLLRRWGMQSFEARKVPRVLTSIIRSYLFMGVAVVPVMWMALALLTRMSIPPNLLTAWSTAFSS